MKRIEGMAEVWLPALELVKTAFNARHEMDSEGRIVKFEQGTSARIMGEETWFQL